MATYQWRDRGPRKSLAHIRKQVSAQAVGDRLEQLRDTGGVTPRRVLDDARAEDSVFHPCFEWDDSVAADKFRIVQARELVMAVHVVIDGDDEQPVTTRAFIHVDDDDDDDDEQGPGRYEPLSVVLGDSVLYSQVLRRAAQELASFQERYSQFASLKRIGETAQQQVLTELEKIAGVAV